MFLQFFKISIGDFLCCYKPISPTIVTDLVLIIIGLGILLYILLKKRKKEETIEYRFEKEKLVVERNYPINILFRYSSTKKTEMEMKRKIAKNSIWY